MNGTTCRVCVRIAALAVSLAVPGCGQQAPPEERNEAPAVEVRTATAEAIDGGGTISVPGVVQAAISAQLSTRQSGAVEEVLVAAGERVAAGDEVLRIDARDLAAARAAALRRRDAAREAEEQARRTRDRFARLFEEDLVAEVRLEEARVEAEQAAGRLQQAEAELATIAMNLEYTRLRAPFAGVISEIIVEEGAFASPGMPLLVLEDRSSLEIDAAVQQVQVAGLRPGDELPVRVHGVADPLTGRVTAVLPAMAPAGAGVRVRLDIEQPPDELMPGMVAEVLLPTPGQGGRHVRIPADALLRKGQLSGVFVVTADPDGVLRAQLRWISVARDLSEGAYVRVQRGLRSGERVVVGDAVQSLADGQPVLPGD
jgi:RND family efflux transporter MFP subunit